MTASSSDIIIYFKIDYSKIEYFRSPNTKRRDSFDVDEAKYLSSALSEKLMEEEIGKIKAIEGIRIGRIGFVSFSGFEKEIDGIDEISGEELYRELP